MDNRSHSILIRKHLIQRTRNLKNHWETRGTDTGLEGFPDKREESFTSTGKVGNHESSLPGSGSRIIQPWPQSGNKEAIVLMEHIAIAATWDQEAADRTVSFRAMSHL